MQVLLTDGRTIGIAGVSPEETVEHLIARIERADPRRGFLAGPRGKTWATRDLKGNLFPDVRLVHLGATLRPNSPIEDAMVKRGALLKLIPGAAALVGAPYPSRPEAKRPWVPRASLELLRQRPRSPPGSTHATTPRAWSPASFEEDARATSRPAPVSFEDDAGATGRLVTRAGSLPAEPPPAMTPDGGRAGARSAPVGGRLSGRRLSVEPPRGLSRLGRRHAVSPPCSAR